MEGDFWIINSQERLETYIAELREKWAIYHYLRAQYKTGKQRTATQNNCLHKYCELLAEELNNAGLDMRKVLKPEIDIPWTKHSAKDQLWRPIQEAMTGHSSTTKPETTDYKEIYLVLDRHMAAKFGVSVPWPSKESMQASRVREAA